MKSYISTKLLCGLALIMAAAFVLTAGVTVSSLTATPAFANASAQPAPPLCQGSCPLHYFSLILRWAG